MEEKEDNGEGAEGGGAEGNWPTLLFECVLQVWQELNATTDLLAPFNASHNIYFDDELYMQLLNLSESGELNGTEWEVGGRDRLAQCLEPPPTDRPYLLPWWQQLTWTLAFGAMLLVAVGGNAIVMWIVIGERQGRCCLANSSLLSLFFRLSHACVSGKGAGGGGLN